MQVQIPTVQAIPLVLRDPETDKYKANQTAIAFITKIPHPVAVISMVGLYRTGKSYLLNKMLLNRRDGGFQVGSTVNACTKGLWIWPEVLKGTTKEGTPVNIIVIDTEGMGSLQQDSSHDIKIFTLAVLLSSSFIYTSVGAIQSSSIQSLSLVVHLAQLVTKGIHHGNQFPEFLWILRDFSLLLTDKEGNSLTPGEYLQLALVEQKGVSVDVTNRNQIRSSIKLFFPVRECVAFQRPQTFITNNLMDVPLQQLKPQFVQTLILTKNRLLTKCHPKLLDGKPINGKTLTVMIQQYTNAVNQGQMPNVMGAWQYINQHIESTSLQETIQSVETEMSQIVLPTSRDSLMGQLESLKQRSLNKISKLSTNTVGKFNQKFEQKKRTLVSKNTQSSRQLILQHLNKKSECLDAIQVKNSDHLKEFRSRLLEFQFQVSHELEQYHLSDYNQVWMQWKLGYFEEQWTTIYKLMQAKLDSQIKRSQSIHQMYNQEAARTKQELRLYRAQNTILIANLKTQKLQLECQLSLAQERQRIVGAEPAGNAGHDLPQGVYKQGMQELKSSKTMLEEQVSRLRQQAQFMIIKCSSLQQQREEFKKSEAHYLGIIQNSPNENKIVFQSSGLGEINQEENNRLKRNLSELELKCKGLEGQKDDLDLKLRLAEDLYSRCQNQHRDETALWQSKCSQLAERVNDITASLAKDQDLIQGHVKCIGVLEQQIGHLQDKLRTQALSVKAQNSLVQVSHLEQQKSLRSLGAAELSRIRAEHASILLRMESKHQNQIRELEQIRSDLQAQLASLGEHNQQLQTRQHLLMARMEASACLASQRESTIISLQKSNIQLSVQNQTLSESCEQLTQQLATLQETKDSGILEATTQLQVKWKFQDERLRNQVLRLNDKLQRMDQVYNNKERIYLRQLTDQQNTYKETIDLQSSSEGRLLQKVAQLEEETRGSKTNLERETENIRRVGLQYQKKEIEWERSLSDLENEKFLVEGNYQRDKILWKGKTEFLEKQRDSQKQHYQQKIRKLEEVIQFIDKSQENYAFQRILKNAGQKYDVLGPRPVRGHQQVSNLKWQHQIDSLKREKDRLHLEYQKSLNSQKEINALKTREMEERLKESQYRRESLVSNHQQEKRSWNREREKLIKTNSMGLQSSYSR